MSDSGLVNFDDPGLKAAVRRVWGAERAPEALRRRIDDLTSAPAPIPLRRPVWLANRRFLALAAAAAVGLVIGIALYVSRPRPALPVTLAQNLIATHDFCCSHPDHHNILYPQTYPEIRRVISKDLEFPVLADDVPGWNFNGFSECRVGSTLTGHLVFKRNAQDLSLFSLPSNVWQGSHPDEEASTVNSNHPIAAFVTSRGIYCVVGSSSNNSLTLNDVQSIREQLRQKMSALAQGDDEEPHVVIVRSH